MYKDSKIVFGDSEGKEIFLYPKMANRHGLIAGATGTGKTVTLRVLAESFSSCGVPIFMADVKGDLATICKAGEPSGSVGERVSALKLDEKGFSFKEYPVNFWDVYGEKGMPLRTTVSEMGPLLLARILDLNETQSSILSVVFKIADDENLLLIDTKDLRSILTFVSEHSKDYSASYGNMAPSSLAAITRSVVALEQEGGELFFGEPALNIADWFSTNNEGKGIIQLLDCTKLINNPTMYSTFLLWMLSELYETLPECGDRPLPKMVFFFDEAHLLFESASKALLTKIEQIVKLIRSKGVGVFFITQNPADIPDGVLGQLGNKVLHALHAYTPNEQKRAKAAANSFRANPEFDTYETLLSLGTGEALVSVLDEKGIPTMAEKCKILPPESKLGALDDVSRDTMIKDNLMYIRYSESIDRDSAYEFLLRNKQMEEEAAIHKKEEEEAEKAQKKADRMKELEQKAMRKTSTKTTQSAGQKLVKSVAKTTAGTIGRQMGNNIGSVLGGSFGKKIGGNVGSVLGRGILNTFLK